MKRHLQLAVLALLACSTVLAAVTSVSTATDAPQRLQQQQQQPQHTLHNQHTHRTHAKHHHHNHHHAQQHHNQQQRSQQLRRQRRLEALETAATPDEQVEFLDKSARAGVLPPQRNGTTRLRRISARDYYNNVVQRRTHTQRSAGAGGNSEWDYHTYNVHSNTFGPPPPADVSGSGSGSSRGKGDDNTQDVEFISHTPEWLNAASPRRGFGFMPPAMAPSSTTPPTATRRSVLVTAAPPLPTVVPPLVPARRGYATAAPPSGSNGAELPHTTEDPFETNTISRNYPSNEPKDMERRHICVQQRTITMPVKTTEVYTRPIWKHVSTPCSAVQVPTHHANQMCTRVQLVHEQAFRDVIRHKSAQQVTYDCCAGWAREVPHADACMKPVCAARCQNGGTCASPDSCSCPAGFTGRYCEHDINECKEEKPCDQTCINTLGSYMCKCREGFVLQSDQQSCKKVDLQDDDAFEARDLENEIETGNNEEVSARLQKIERSLANERVHTNELKKSLQATYNVVDTLKSRLSTLEKQQQDINRLQSNLFVTESRTHKLEGMLNLLMKCRNGPNAYCP